MRGTLAVGLGLGVALVLSACSGTPGVEGQGGVLDDVEFDGQMRIEPLQSIAGAERVVVEGVGIDVPPGSSAEEVVLSDEITQLVITSEGRERADAVVTVARLESVTDTDVFLDIKAGVATVDPALLRDVEELNVDWPGFAFALALKGEVDTGEGEFREFLYLATRDDGGGRSISVSCEAPDGAVEDSLGYQLLRTVRVDGR